MIDRLTVTHTDRGCLHIGLINNMPDAALEATERQFRTLLSEATGGPAVRLSLFAVPEIARSEEAARRIASSYLPVSELWDQHLDGLIVSGAEPVARNLKDERFWPCLTQLVKWAETNTHSVIWSCLAAQAAVLCMDGITRRPLGDKLFGVFESEKTAEHPLTADVPGRFWTPHSRWNDLSQDELRACSYSILSHLKGGSVADAFVKQTNTLHVFLLGHPEYDPDSLLLEYRRDVRRFLAGERELCPAMPQGYFEEKLAVALSALRARLISDRSVQSLAEFPAAMRAATVKNMWRSEAIHFYRNWLGHLMAQQEQKAKTKNGLLAYLNSAVTALPGPLVPEVEAG